MYDLSKVNMETVAAVIRKIDEIQYDVDNLKSCLYCVMLNDVADLANRNVLSNIDEELAMIRKWICRGLDKTEYEILQEAKG